MRRSVILLLLLSCLTFQGFGQRAHFLNFQAGAGIGKVRDLMHSPLIYKGAQIPSELAYLRQTDTSSRKIALGFTWGLLKPGINPELTDSRIERLKFRGGYTAYERVSKWEQRPVSIFLGGSWKNLLTFRSGSFSGLSFGTFASSISFRPKISYSLRIFEHRAEVSYSLGFPFLTFIIRSGYAGSPPKGFRGSPDKGFIGKSYESGKILRPLKFIRLKSDLRLAYYLDNGNFLSLSYRFDYYEYDQPELIESGSHNFMLGTAFKF